ncbi:hypothetical protein [Dehalobacterium formicoaceticum]|uniref:YveK family protein n=1 Tax=Dehalobacterium formicoaceticum TaxID=51515 RepID=UPI0031F6256D
MSIHYYQLFKKSLGFMILFALLCAGTMAALSYWVIPKMYEANVSMMIIKNPDSGSEYFYDELIAGREIINDYREILNTDSVLYEIKNEVSRQITGDSNISLDDLRKRINFESFSDSRVFTITYRDTDPYHAQIVVDSIAKVLKTRIVTLTQVDNIAILGAAQLPVEPVSPNIVTNGVIAFMLSLFAAFIFVIFIDYLRSMNKKVADYKIKTNLP